MENDQSSWICCQIGAREHYAIPRALQGSGHLKCLMTDAWVPTKSLINHFPHPAIKPLRERFHPELASANVRSFTASLVRFEVTQKMLKAGEWQRTIARNDWFQHKSLLQLSNIRQQCKNSNLTLFTYSYAALNLLRFAKHQGWHTILGQTNPGIVEEQIVQAEQERNPTLSTSWQPAPTTYWENWQEECQVADKIMVNSTWSAQALQQAGIPQHKIHIVPLAYEPPPAASRFQRSYPAKFSVERPLRVLFLGQVILRKGVIALFEAAQKLQGQPIEFWMVGTTGVMSSVFQLPNVRWFGSVPRSEVERYYQQADVFLFPTLSDGFGLTQLEAQAWKLPLIASPFCGKVVNDGKNGILLSEISAGTLAETLLYCLDNPECLHQFSLQATVSQFSLSRLQSSLENLGRAMQ